MNKPLSSVTAGVYKHALKHILFLMKPDGVHKRLVRTGSIVQRISLARWLINKTWSYQDVDYLSQSINGVYYGNPVGLSAGFDKNIELAPLLKAVGFGFMEGGSITYRKCAGNPRPWFYRLPKSRSLVVYAGLGNHGVRAILKRFKKYPGGLFNDFPLNISVAKTNDKTTVDEKDGIADYVGSLKLIKQAKAAQMVTLNISCPNAFGGEPFTKPAKLKRLLKAVGQVGVEVPVFIKMPSDLAWKDFDALLAVADSFEFVKGVIISNLAKDRTKLKLSDPLLDSVKGSLSGKPVQELSDNLIKQTYRAYGKRFTIIGVGGIFSAEDAYKKITLGASLVALVTGMIFEGPQLIGNINKGLSELIKKDGFSNISEAIGTKA